VALFPRNPAQRRFAWVQRISLAAKVVALLGFALFVAVLLGVR